MTPRLDAFSIADLRGAVRLVTQATTGAARIAEGVHDSVWRAVGFPGLAPGQTRGITGLVYRSLNTVTHLVGGGVDRVLAEAERWDGDTEPSGTAQRAAFLAALNGVLGDRLAADGNPLATQMALLYRGETLPDTPSLDLPDAGPHPAMLIHGLCMDERAWEPEEGPGQHEALAALGYTPVALRYNSGLHVSQNGRALAALLEDVVGRWPGPVETLSVVAHSMGGLVMRSAVYYAREGGMQWPESLRHLVFLGTPHHGALLERAGNQVDRGLSSTPFTAPFAALGQLRSAGITDLRYGFVLDQEWEGLDRFGSASRHRVGLPMPDGVACYAVAATRSSHGARGKLKTDGLVSVPSAFGVSSDPRWRLDVPETRRHVAYGTHHVELLRSPEVTEQVARWLA